MRMEYGFDPAQGNARRRMAFLGLAFAVLVGVIAPAAGQAPEESPAPAADEPPWRDLDQALLQLSEAQAAILDARGELRAAEAELERLLGGVEDNTEDTLAIASELQATQDRARRLAVEAYINGGPITDSLFVLDADSANDFAFRATLLSESARAVASAQTDYAALRNAASEEAVDLADRIDDAKARIRAAELAIVDAEAVIPGAEWVIEIAEIHRGADDLMERWGRIEPTPENWDDLRFCESTRNYQINTGNGYYGAYQFDIVTWVDMGGSGLPSEAPPEEQDARARYLYALRGSGYNRGGAWPVCGRFLPSG
jgi:hypothetical protein